MIITISRQYAAGGSSIAQTVASRLGWSLVDNRFVDEVAARAGLTRDEVAEREERAPGFMERLSRALATSVPEYVLPEGTPMPDLGEADLVRVTEHVVREIAGAGRVVMVGRATPAVLASHPDALHVRLVAPREVRVARAIERLGIPAGVAERFLDETDQARARYHRQYYDRDWEDPAQYHLTLNTAALGFDGAAELILARARAIWGERP
jgi:cytidylate kinase